MANPDPRSDSPEAAKNQAEPRGYGTYGTYGNYGSYGGNYGGYNPRGYGQYQGYGVQGGAGSGMVATYINMVRERFWWLVLSILVFVTIALIFTYNTMPEYRAVGRLKVLRYTPDLAKADSAAAQNFNIVSNDDFYTAVESMRSNSIIENVSRRLTIGEKKQVLEPYQQGNIFSGPLTEQEVFGRQRAINPQRMTLVVNVEFVHPNRELARQVAQLFCQAIQKNNEDERLIITNPLVEKVRIDIESYQDKVKKLYEQKNAIIRDQKLLAIAKDTATLGTERGVLVKDREETRKQVDEFQILWDKITEYQKLKKDPYEIPQVHNDPAVLGLGVKVSDLRVQVSALQQKYTPEHPTLQQTQKALEQTQDELKKAVVDAVERIRGSFENARSRYDSIVKNLEEKEKEISKLQAANVELERLEKDIRASEEFLARLTLSYEEAKLRSSMSGSTTSIKIMDMPSVGDKPINKNYYINALVGLALGLVFGIGLVILMGSFDNRVKSAKDVELTLGLPLLGTVPKVSEATGPDRALLARQDKDRIATEAVRAIYSVMKVNPATATSRVFLVTSTRPGEGKTFVATNLALTFAQHAEKVIIIDADLRLPNVGPSLGFAGDGGVSRWFNSEMTLDEAIVREVAPGLDVLPVGINCKNPTQVINNPKFSEMLDELRRRYDRVFIDSPPIGAVSDALHLIPKVDGVIYVVRYNLVTMRNATSCLLRLRDAGAPILGAVLNRMSQRMASVYTDSYDSSYRKYYTGDHEEGIPSDTPPSGR